MSDVGIVAIVALIVMAVIAAFFFGRGFRANINPSGLNLDASLEKRPKRR